MSRAVYDKLDAELSLGYEISMRSGQGYEISNTHTYITVQLSYERESEIHE